MEDKEGNLVGGISLDSDPLLHDPEAGPSAHLSAPAKEKRKSHRSSGAPSSPSTSSPSSPRGSSAPAQQAQREEQVRSFVQHQEQAEQQQQQQGQAQVPAGQQEGPEPTRRRYPVFSEENSEDIKHFVKQIYAITIPVLICIVLVIWWVQVREAFTLAASISDPFGFVTIDGDTTRAAISQGVINALIIIASIIVFTIIFVILFWFGFHKVIVWVLVITIIVTLAGQGGIFLWYELEAVNLPLDWISFAFVLWNFTVVGLWVVFRTGPLRVQQAYLVVLSALMAFVFTQIDEWTTWVLLAFLVLWDLFAVLTPCGPLKLLIEASQRQNVEIPALLYSVTMVFFMADDESVTKRKKSKKEKKDKKDKKERRSRSEREVEEARPDRLEADSEQGSSSANQSQSASSQVQRRSQPSQAGASPSTEPLSPTQVVQMQLAEQDAVNAQQAGEEEDERDGLKLGLGDFVFYSVLVGRAVLTDWTTLFACVVAVLTGLNGTILLLAIFQKALPALPISLTLGLIFYFLTSLVVSPLEDVLQARQIFV